MSTTLASNAGVLHVESVGRAVAAHAAQERKDVLADHDEHLGRGKILETRPAEVVVGPAPGVLALGEDPARHRLLQDGRLALLQRVRVIQPADEQEVGDLLDDFERVGDAAGPEGVPDGVDLAAKFAGQQW
jgi:hypothetical protein